MRHVEYWETEADGKADFHYRLIVESKDFLSGYLIKGQFIGCDSIESIFIPEEKVRDEKTGIFDMMRSLFWEIKEIPSLSALHRRMHTLANADYDSARDSGRVPRLIAEEEAIELGSEEWYSRSMKALDEALTLDEGNCIVSGPVVIDGVRHRVADKFIVCDSSLNRRAWNATEEEAVCMACYPAEGEADPVVLDPFFIPETGEQLELFG